MTSLPTVQDLELSLVELRYNMRAAVEPEYKKVHVEISSTHSWILKNKNGMSFYECTVCKLDASSTISYPLHKVDEPVQDNFPIMTWNHHLLYLTCEQNLERKALKTQRNRPWKVFIMRCEGLPRHVFIGKSTNLYQTYMDQRERRYGKKKKQNMTHGYPVEIIYVETFTFKPDATRRENQIKMLTKLEISDLVKGTI